MKEPAAPPKILEEFSSWTLIEDVLMAFRIIEGRTSASDQPASSLKVLIPRDEKVQPFARTAIVWLTQLYRCPEPQLRLASETDSAVASSTVEVIHRARFTGKWSEAEVLPPGTICSSLADADTMYIEAEPFFVELLQRPVMALADLIWKFSIDSGQMRKAMQSSDNKPQIWHQSRADSPLAALVETAVRSAIGWPIGVHWAQAGEFSTVVGFRCFSVQGVPPIDTRMLRLTHEMYERLCRELSPSAR